MNTQQTRLPPQVRRRINQRAHELAQAAESRIRAQLTAQARAAAKAGTPPGELLWRCWVPPVMTMQELYEATTTPEQRQAQAEWLAGLKPLDDLTMWTPNAADGGTA